ncbi:PaaI family thioesterase [Streptomyces botrytidirepellens]|uniref:PaaI family thioesterase n=1 Tax=Streptomyces botrytidirepellens TaxID=2486417 RepID=UPI00160DFEF6
MGATAGRTSGVEVRRDLLERRLPPPPIVAAPDFALEEVEEGRVVFSLVPGEEHDNSTGGVRGGVYATLLDSAAGGQSGQGLLLGLTRIAVGVAGNAYFIRSGSACTTMRWVPHPRTDLLRDHLPARPNLVLAPLSAQSRG